jgi:hypothetical protein
LKVDGESGTYTPLIRLVLILHGKKWGNLRENGMIVVMPYAKASDLEGRTAPFTHEDIVRQFSLTD